MAVVRRIMQERGNMSDSDLVSIGVDPITGQQIFEEVPDEAIAGTDIASAEPLTTLPEAGAVDFTTNIGRHPRDSRPEDTLGPLGTISRERAAMRGSAAAGVEAGQQFGFATPSGAERVVQLGAAAATGFLAGGPIGAVTAVASSGVQQFLANRAENRRRKEFRRLRRDAERARREEIARDERWKRINRFDDLRATAFNRRQTVLSNNWQAYQNLNTQFINLINNNQTLKERFAKLGF